ncbi:hypothetical protein QE152_g1789 [Popillia japonica]|uniref:Secreted protein n=1 Tax=Popillia japonica TaxID=7064 RepID=A0AAW1N527_POPJA
MRRLTLILLWDPRWGCWDRRVADVASVRVQERAPKFKTFSARSTAAVRTGDVASVRVQERAPKFKTFSARSTAAVRTGEMKPVITSGSHKVRSPYSRRDPLDLLPPLGQAK